MEPIKSAKRALAVLELFSLRQRPLRVGEVALDLGMPQPSASILLRSLATLGYLAHDPAARTYFPTLRVVLLAGWIAAEFSGTQALSRRLAALGDKFAGLSTFIGIQNGPWAQYVLVQDEPGRMMIASGQLRLLTCSALGRVLLSLKRDDEVRKWVRRCNAEAEDRRHRVNEPAFLGMIERARRQGHAETSGDWRAGYGAIAVNVPSPVGDMPLGVGIGGDLDLLLHGREAIVQALLVLKAELEGAVPPLG